MAEPQYTSMGPGDHNTTDVLALTDMIFTTAVLMAQAQGIPPGSLAIAMANATARLIMTGSAEQSWEHNARQMAAAITDNIAVHLGREPSEGCIAVKVDDIPPPNTKPN